MINSRSCDIIPTDEAGFVDCPYCGAHKILKPRRNTTAENLPIFCRRCKREILVDIHQGQCRLSRSR